MRAQDFEFGPQKKNMKKKIDVAVCVYHHNLVKMETGESLLTGQAAHTAR